MGQRASLLSLSGLVLFLGLTVAHAVEMRGPSTETSAGTYRFQVLRDYEQEAVRDLVTGLTWERSPSATGIVWSRADAHCGLKTVGGVKGWRVPSFFELMTLVDPSVTVGEDRPMLPPSHPFHGIRPAAYWSHNSLPDDPSAAYAVDFRAGDLAPLGKQTVSGLWCVRGSIARSSTPERPLQLVRLSR